MIELRRWKFLIVDKYNLIDSIVKSKNWKGKQCIRLWMRNRCYDRIMIDKLKVDVVDPIRSGTCQWQRTFTHIILNKITAIITWIVRYLNELNTENENSFHTFSYYLFVMYMMSGILLLLSSFISPQAHFDNFIIVNLLSDKIYLGFCSLMLRDLQW